MKNRIIIFALIVAVATSFIACNKDFESNAPYKDATIVYGIINSKDNTHYIKIYKGFLTENDAYTVASEYDSLYYFDKIEVVVEEYVNGSLTATYQLDTTTSIPRDPGDFSSPKQLLYYFTQQLRNDAEYQLKITNKETGRIVTGKTKVVGDFNMNSPPPGIELIIHNATSNPIKFSAPTNAVAYDVYQYFYYIERDKTTGVETEKFVKRKVNTSVLTSVNMEYIPSSIFISIASGVQANANVDRFLKSDSAIKFEIWAISDDLFKYIQVGTPNSSVVMDRLNYTNLHTDDNLVAGIFASRKKAEAWYRINQISQDSLVRGSVTRNLGFHYFYDR